jgi:hypothetical protein
MPVENVKNVQEFFQFLLLSRSLNFLKRNQDLSRKETTHQTLLARIQINVKSLFIVLEKSFLLLKPR